VTPHPRPLMLRGEVRHTRHRPRRHAFRYDTYALLLPMRALAVKPCDALARNRFGLLSFHDRDHGDGGSDALQWVETLLRQEGVEAEGEIWLQTYPRVLNYVFKPVSFWYVQRHDGSLAAVVAEVNNTFGERHVYLLDGPDVAWGATLHAHKVFHVSPFCEVRGSYHFRFMRTPQRIVARIDHDDSDVDADAGGKGPILSTSLSGVLNPLTSAMVRRVFWGSPLMTAFVTLRIHWQALRLWAKRIPLFSKPEAPRALTSR
jgi:uncharacterized protein